MPLLVRQFVPFFFCCCFLPSLSMKAVTTGSLNNMINSRINRCSLKPYRLSRLHMSSTSNNDNPSPVTGVTIRPTDWKIDHTSSIHLVGSCFTDTIGTALKKYKFKCFSNGQGIMFNPISISECLNNVIQCKSFTVKDIFNDINNIDTYHSWHHHSSYSSLSVPSMLENMNNDIKSANINLQEAKTLFITLGTARVHKLKNSNVIVSNCHKQPGYLFDKKLLTVNEIVESLSQTFEDCKAFNPNIKIVLTVSPVRHTREGIAENSLSKSTLICAVHTLLDKYPSLLYYFPSYEIMIDELRDYRWYGDDLIHPSSVAQNIIFKKFTDCFVSEKASAVMKRIAALQADINHRPSEALKASISYKNHVKRTLQKTLDLQVEFKGYLTFEEEERIMRDRLNAYNDDV